MFLRISHSKLQRQLFQASYLRFSTGFFYFSRFSSISLAFHRFFLFSCSLLFCFIIFVLPFFGSPLFWSVIFGSVVLWFILMIVFCIVLLFFCFVLFHSVFLFFLRFTTLFFRFLLFFEWWRMKHASITYINFVNNILVFS